MKPDRWTEITPSEYAWEHEALEYLKARLPDGEPFRAWSNFEFIAGDGSINEVDLLVVSLHKVYLVEIKSWSGTISGDSSTWRREVDGREFLLDSPLLLANRKAKKLGSILKAQKALAKKRRPFIEAVVFLSRMGVRCWLEGIARTGVYLAAGSEQSDHPSILDVLIGNAGFDPRRPPSRIDPSLSRTFGQAMKQAGIQPSQRQRRVADYRVRELLLETDTYQDWEAEHVSVPSSKRRVRIYPLQHTSSESMRAERRRMAEREYELLDGITHDGILRVELLTTAEQGPALVFEHDPNAERLDHFLARQRSDELDLKTRLDLLRQLAEALKYAHERRLFHRTLSPQKVLVLDRDSTRPKLKIFDWQTGTYDALVRSGESGGQVSATLTTLGMSGDDQSDVYLAPDTTHGSYLPEKLDVFSLGAIGYRLLAGRPPAPTVAGLLERLSVAGGLQLSDAIDGIHESLQLVIEGATEPEVSKRLDSVSEFLDLLVDAERELARAEEAREAGVHPMDALPGDMLEHGFLVERRLGKGSTAVALQIAHDDGGGVLKVALDSSLNERVRCEGELLHSLSHPNIVKFFRHVELSGHQALFMAMAGAENKSGTYTLADRIREEGRLSLDLLERFGNQLLSVVQWLEEQGISHRDLKPDNIGVSASGTDKSLGLVVFDFSLADTPAENIRAGTPPYLDPFLRQRQPPRWDVYAERFATAMTLHEMATGSLPGWGDGLTDPMLVEDEVTLELESFDPSVRAVLAEFFTKALARNHLVRFDSAETMRRAWDRCFEAIDLPTTGDEEGADLPGDLAGVTRETPLLALGLSPRLLNALDRLGAHTVAELVALPRIRLYRNKGIGQRIVKLIRELSERFAERLADSGRTRASTTSDRGDESPISPSVWSINLLASKLVSSKISDEAARLVRGVLGLEDNLDPFPTHSTVAESLGESPTETASAVRRARDRWSRQDWMAPLRESVAALVASHGGIMTVQELADALAATRGSTETGDARLRRSGAVVIAALETESDREDARFLLHRHGTAGGGRALVLSTESLDLTLTASVDARAEWVCELGRLADEVAASDPLIPPVRVTEVFAGATPPPGMPLLEPERIQRLAVESAEHTAVSSRGELYPQGMSEMRAAKLGASSLVGPTKLSASEIRRRIASRYPAARLLPERPQLDDLLESAGLKLEWDGQGGVYRSPAMRSSYESSTSSAATPTSIDDGGAEADAVDERLMRVIKTRGFLALSVSPRNLASVERRLVTMLKLTPFSLEAGLIRHMRAIVEELEARWDVVVAADAAPPGSKDRQRLAQLVRRSMPGLTDEIASAPESLLLSRPGLLARYRQLDLLTDVQDACQRGNAPAARVLCIAADATMNMPVIDGHALPVVFTAAWTRPNRDWLARATSAAASGASPVVAGTDASHDETRAVHS